MKRFIIVGLVCLLFSNTAFAKEEILPIKPDAKPIDIIYIHGAYETKEAFDKSVNNVHEDMVKQFESDPLMHKKLLKGGCKKISDTPIIFFWADKTTESLKIIDKDETGIVFECMNLDKETNRCKIHKKRPGICRRYPQEELFMMGGTLAEHCGYRLEPIESFDEVFEKVSRRRK